MLAPPDRLFLPGWGAGGSLYGPGLPEGWRALEPPSFLASRGSFSELRRWLVAELDRHPGPVELAGHSMGGALAIAAAAERPDRVSRLLLITPAGTPLAKPFRRSVVDFARQVALRRYPADEAWRGCRRVLRAPRAALRLARAVHAADLSLEMARVRDAHIPVTVVGCASDTLISPGLCRRISRLLGARYVELALDGGHMWMLRDWQTLAAQLTP